jgi:hypothetical protein
MSGIVRQTLPKTGPALMVGSFSIWQLGLIGVAIGIVAIAATFVRVGYRRNKNVGQA